MYNLHPSSSLPSLQFFLLLHTNRLEIHFLLVLHWNWLALHPPVEINIPLPINIQFSESLDVIKTVFPYYNPYYRGGLLGLCGINPIINSFWGQLVNACFAIWRISHSLYIKEKCLVVVVDNLSLSKHVVFCNLSLWPTKWVHKAFHIYPLSYMFIDSIREYSWNTAQWSLNNKPKLWSICFRRKRDNRTK